jgi:phosphoribosyl 1,2-cyclic phosphate phosphodiesterase
MQGGKPPCLSSGHLLFCAAMKILILGSGTSTGVPMVGCRCPVCSSADPRDQRTRASLLIRHAGKTILVDTSTDLRNQMLRETVERIDAVLFTHAHADHVNGIDDLRGFYFLHRQEIPCYACPATMARLLSGFNYIFHRDEGATHPALLEARIIDGPFVLFGLEVVPIPLEHGAGVSCGYRIGSFAYLTDCSSIPAPSLALLQGVATVVIDGLRWLSHPYHFNIAGAIDALRPLQAGRIILTHLTHDVLHAEEARLPDGVVFAYDGMVIEL